MKQLHLDLDYLRTLRVWICTPSFGGLSYVAHFTCVFQLSYLLKSYGITHTIKYLPNDSLITRARNNLTDQFMNSEMQNRETDFMLWFDGDITFTPMDIIAMLQLTQNPEYDFLAAPYSRKGLHWDRIAEAARLNWPSPELQSVSGDPNVNYLVHPITLNEPMPLLEAGTGFLLIRRKVFEQYRDFYKKEIEYQRTPDETSIYGRKECYNYFHAGIDPETREYLSEDWWFCRHWIRTGGNIFGCMWIKTGHIGQIVYQMDMPAIAKLLEQSGGYLHGPTRMEKEKADAKVSEEGKSGTGDFTVPAGGWKSRDDRY